jgi:hypothetical protein
MCIIAAAAVELEEDGAFIFSSLMGGRDGRSFSFIPMENQL